MDNNGGKSALGLDANVAAGIACIPIICLIGVIFSIIILVTDKTNKLARFYAFQSLLLHAVVVVTYILGIVIVFAGVAANSGLLASLGGVIYVLGFLVVFILLIICMIMAFQGKIFKVPVIGGMADSWSN